ncbi:DUF1775 domain-containing protein [Deinococcus roseus]|uniref:YncI copper-binding domain-containing protein n=1 Tax=Deinococcus roseus TaxID=392414 RepID=A0ABQ2D2A4_9DEIO|nr:DUF1775 domain-containing protein [Deinococcus roseus]GGJ42868.1 hypothetical protein GCM10008938_31360 [Deinococcus roseus]
MLNTKTFKTLFASSALLWSAAQAHVVVTTDTGAFESQAGKYQIYRMMVPNEAVMPAATTRVRLQVPEGMDIWWVKPVPRWTYTLEKDAAGRTTALVWQGMLKRNEFELFYFFAVNPKEKDSILHWKAQQTFIDGTVWPWDGSSDLRPDSMTLLK